MRRLSRAVCLAPCLVAAVAVSVGTLGAAPAAALVPVLKAETISIPTNLPPAGNGRLLVSVSNLGDENAASPVLLTDVLPAGVEATSVNLQMPGAPGGRAEEFGSLFCTVIPQEVKCEIPPAFEALAAYGHLEAEIEVKVKRASGTVFNEVHVGSSGADGSISREALTVSETPASFGVERYNLVATNEDGSVDTQAGSHPFQLTTTLRLTNKIGTGSPPEAEPAAFTKDLHFDLPAGLIGDPQVVPQCTGQEFGALIGGGVNACPAETAVGIASFVTGLGGTHTVPLFNLTPSVGEPARFGFSFLGVPVILDTSVRTGGDYGVIVSVNNVSQTLPFYGSQVTFWGVPADPRHNGQRGWGCIEGEGAAKFGTCTASSQPKVTPFLSLPTSCSGPTGMRATVEADSWTERGVFKRVNTSWWKMRVNHWV